MVGPEAPLVNGISNVLSENKINVFGPTKEAALLEGSKSFMKVVALYGMRDLRR